MQEIRVHFRPVVVPNGEFRLAVSIDCSAFKISVDEIVEDVDAVEYYSETRIVYRDEDGDVNVDFGPELKDFLRECGWSHDEDDLSFVVSAVLNSSELMRSGPVERYLPDFVNSDD